MTPPRPKAGAIANAPPSTLAKRYLLAYNVVMTAGWMVILFRLVRAVAQSDQLAIMDVYSEVSLPLQIFQTAAILEVLHSALRIIRAPLLTTALQVASRLLLVWGVCAIVPEVRATTTFESMVLAWSLTEIPRYFYFAVSSVMTAVPFWVVYLRYSTFLPLYPLGAGSEWLNLYQALPFIRESKLLTFSLPNRYNLIFDYFWFSVLVLLLYIPGLPYMYLHMMRQRAKYIGPSKPSSSASASTTTSHIRSDVTKTE